MSPLNPLDHSICLATPKRFADSAWAGHVPFAMYLVSVLRPRVIVELGTFTGVSYCAFCQAVKTLGLRTRCYAVDTWFGDEQTGFYDSTVLDDLKGHHDPLYAEFSSFLHGTFDEALSRFGDSSIDLLHIDGGHAYDSVKHDFEVWLPKMSDRGVMILHDIGVRDRGFGVWRLWLELKEVYPHFEFEHQYGLGVLKIGAASQGLDALLNAAEAEAGLIRDFFARIGESLQKVTEENNEKSRQDIIDEQKEVMNSLLRELDSREQALQRFSTEALESQRALHALAEHLTVTETQLNEILGSRAWRWVTRYGRVKNRIFKPQRTKTQRVEASDPDVMQASSVGSENRFSQPGDLVPPPELQAYIGGGFREVGPEFLAYFRDLCELKPNHRVLDVGCGSGRMAVPLTEYLNSEGLYEGFDISAKAVEWCVQNITSQFPNFHFQVADVHNPSYNSTAKFRPGEYVFPYENNYFDFVFLASVFTHMLPRDMEPYLAQIARVLKPGGRCLITFFLLNPESRALMPTATPIHANVRFDFKHLVQYGCQAMDRNKPEDALAYDESFARTLFQKYGLRIDEPIRYGSWCGRENYLSLQDIVVAIKND
jgi:SAM-dependent methyltransferase